MSDCRVSSSQITTVWRKLSIMIETPMVTAPPPSSAATATAVRLSELSRLRGARRPTSPNKGTAQQPARLTSSTTPPKKTAPPPARPAGCRQNPDTGWWMAPEEQQRRGDHHQLRPQPPSQPFAGICSPARSGSAHTAGHRSGPQAGKEAVNRAASTPSSRPLTRL